MSMPKPERIGYVLKMYPRFSETFIVTEILAREEQGDQVRIYSMRPPADPRFHGMLADVAAPVRYMARVRSAATQWEMLAGAQDLPGWQSALPELLRADASDAVQAIETAHQAILDGVTHLHAHFASMATSIARLASLLTGIPYSFTAHAKDLFHESVDRADLARKIDDADHVVTVSDFNVRFLRAFAGTGTPIHRVYNGIDLDAFPYRLGAQSSAVVDVVAVGRLVEKKGFADLIDAIAELRRGGREVSCRIIGGGEQEEQLASRIAERGVHDLVTLAGPMPQEQIRGEMRHARVFAAPCVVGSDGNADGLPTVLLEAMALGTPCISTDVTGIPEAIRDRETGVTVAQHAPAELANAIARLIDDAPLADELRAAARVLVSREFGSARQAEQLAALLPRDTTRQEAA